MGGGISSSFSPDESQSGQTNIDLSIGLELGYSRKDIAKLFKFYRLLDIHKSGIITSHAISQSLDLVNLKFAGVVMKLFDVKGNNKINFIDFIVTIWNILTTEESHLATFTFNLLDVQGNGKLLLHEIMHIIEKMLDFPLETKSLVKDLFIRLNDTDGVITVESFKQAAEEFPFLLNLVYCMCAKLKVKSLGKERSSELLVAREAIYGSQSLLDIVSKMKHKPSNYEQLIEDHRTNLDTIISEISNDSEMVIMKSSIPSVFTMKIDAKTQQKLFESNVTARSSSSKCLVPEPRSICKFIRTGSASSTSRHVSVSSSPIDSNVNDNKNDKALQNLLLWSTDDTPPNNKKKKKKISPIDYSGKTTSQIAALQKLIESKKAINTIEGSFWMPNERKSRSSSRSARAGI
jgi:Ca2+-binding EF-hand superfamily protein